MGIAKADLMHFLQLSTNDVNFIGEQDLQA